MPAFSPSRRYELTAIQIDIITYCVNQQLKEFSPQEDNEARKLLAELNSGGEPTDPPISDPSDPYYNSCDI